MTSIATDAKNSSLTQHMDITITHCDQEELAGRLHDALQSLGFSTSEKELGKLVVVVITDSYFTNPERVRQMREAVQAGARIQPVVHAKDKTRKDELLKLAPEDLQLLGEIKWVVLDENFLQLLGEIKSVVQDEDFSKEEVLQQLLSRNASIQALSAPFQDLDIIRDDLDQALGGWEPPVVVVFGAESSGKSTILERVTMLSLFPTGKGICTRLPILVSVRQSTEFVPPRLTVVEDGKDIDYDDIDVEEKVREYMLNSVKRENESVCGVSKKSHIKLVVSGPNYPNLDLLDLPGLVVNHGPNEPKSMERTRTIYCTHGSIKQRVARSTWPSGKSRKNGRCPKSTGSWTSTNSCGRIRLGF